MPEFQPPRSISSIGAGSCSLVILFNDFCKILCLATAAQLKLERDYGYSKEISFVLVRFFAHCLVKFGGTVASQSHEKPTWPPQPWAINVTLLPLLALNVIIKRKSGGAELSNINLISRDHWAGSCSQD